MKNFLPRSVKPSAIKWSISLDAVEDIEEFRELLELRGCSKFSELSRDQGAGRLPSLTKTE